MILCRWFLSLQLVLICAIWSIFSWAAAQVENEERFMASARRALVHRMQLTDLAIWTEARYTRHPSQADLFTPFQEFPGAPEHFPAGSLLAPPPFNLTTQFKVITKAATDQ
jgi:hypothetical protein